MAIFSRRVVQTMLNENRLFLPDTVVDDHVKKLNAYNRQAITTEWEVLVLNALGKIGKLEYEKKFSGPKIPDIFFEQGIVPEFIADITSVNDEDYEDNNPQEYLFKCIQEYFGKYEETLSGLDIQIESDKIGDYRDRKVKLSLPDKSNIMNFVKTHFPAILELKKSEPQKPFQKIIVKDGANIKVSYHPKNIFVGGGWSSYNVPYSLKNPIYNRLKQKSDQLKESGFKGIAGVFLCDGGCYALQSTTHGPEAYSKKDIIREVFRQNSTLSFVIIITVDEKHYLKLEFYANPQAKYLVNKNFVKSLDAMCAHFPRPECTPVNAFNYIKLKRHEGTSHVGGFTMSRDEIRISSRVLTEILAGSIDNEKLDYFYGDKKGKNEMKDFFKQKLYEGKMIEHISITRTPDNDDDWVDIKYGPIDPAISKFK